MTEVPPASLPPGVIQIVWSGPYPFADRDKFYNDQIDFGIYQICGTYEGTTGLIYIGRARNGSFGWRLEHHAKNKLVEYKVNDASFYVGRLAGVTTPSNARWEQEINLAESLLIFAHRPPLNIRVGLGELETDVEGVHVCNSGALGSLLPEVSGLRWTNWGQSLPKNVYDVGRIAPEA